MIKNLIKNIFIFFLFIIFLVVIFFIVEFIFARVTNEYKTYSNLEYEMYLKSNGVHTDIILPLDNNIIYWAKLFPFENTLSKSKDFNYISIGWGDKGFYLDTPTWSELKVSTALVAGLGIGSTAFHITYYKDIEEDDLTIKVPISKEQYASIVSTVKKNLQYENGNAINIKTKAQYGENDAFYEATGSYSIFHTCNTWTNNTLKEAELPSSKWLVFDKGILYQYKKFR
ncbi:TIGR02117 family protein [Arcobacter vandammei]|uniref:TIGR02117 family protein n=1 Tax=Arcobacter vandammei TaxID=2782243 RepID=UPI0018DFB1A8|nr:TIGR02117 family protein [Arcobacter vandammei]